MRTNARQLRYPVRFVTASALFDGHDVSINIIRRMLQASGVEVIHLGHNRSVVEIVETAIQEDAQGIAVSSYQGGHVEFLKYMVDLLKERGADHVRVFAGGGGVIVPSERKALHAYGVAKVFSPDDGRVLGLQGMIEEMIEASDFPTPKRLERDLAALSQKDVGALGKLITLAEEFVERPDPRVGAALNDVRAQVPRVPTLGITGTGGAGKSTLTDELVRRFLACHPNRTIAVLSVDPTKQKTGGALLGDRIRMNAIHHPRVYMRSLATRGSGSELSAAIQYAIALAKTAGYDLIVVETSGIGQGGAGIVDLVDLSMYVMTSEFGAATQLEKIDMIDFADFIVINKFERRGSEDALRDVRKQFKRARGLFDVEDERLPVFGTMASRFNDPATNALFAHVMKGIDERFGTGWLGDLDVSLPKASKQKGIIPAEQAHYLGEIAQTAKRYRTRVEQQVDLARKRYQLRGTRTIIAEDPALVPKIDEWIARYERKLDDDSKRFLEEWPKRREGVASLYTESLSGTKIPKLSLPKFADDGELLRWGMKENLPGFFPYTAGVFPFKRTNEDPKRMFAGEGTPERTNRRFHFLCEGEPAKRLSTAFDSVTLYGHDPDPRPDIYGKIGNSGVNVCTLEDMKRLYAGFDLRDPSTSVSMTINGPAPIILAMFFNAAIEQQIEAFAKKEGRLPTNEEAREIKAATLRVVRGTVQADILKEDQGQNTCIFSTEFALKMMGDMQQYFIEQDVRNFYSVSVSGYHIAEAGANPITQLAFTLANGFTFVEYYLSRGMKIDDFAPNFSFFFSNGLDPEYTVLGRVARRIWAIVIRDRYGGNERSQKLKYHVQTSGRSLHAQEMAFNDIRTTLQALMAIYDNCNSLHTNAYDEAITTPTEQSVRQAMAIQMIIMREYGLAKNENPLQGSFIIEELTDLVEEAVLAEFERLNDRGGVLGAMETQYQRGKIQDESLFYEHKKHSGELPIVGVNTFLNPNASEDDYEIELARSTEEEKQTQIQRVNAFREKHKDVAPAALRRLKDVARSNGNVFAELMDTVKVATLGQITEALYEVGGKYRRNM